MIPPDPLYPFSIGETSNGGGGQYNSSPEPFHMGFFYDE